MTKKFLKQLINLLLVLSIVFQSGFFVYGEEEIQEEEIQETLEEAIEETEIEEEKPVEETVEEEPCFYLNPAWAPFFTEEQVKALIEENREVIAPSIYGKQHNIAVPQFHNIEDAIEAIRNAMINRVASIRIHVNFPYDKGKSAIWQDIYAQANAELNEYQKVIVLGVGGLNGTVDTGTGNVKGYLTFRFAHYFNTNEQEEEFETALQQTMDQLNIYEASDYDKVLAIYNFITANTSYDREHVDDDTYLLKHSAYAALINHTAVCQGFALLFYRMATAAGLNAHYLIGTGNGVGHAWNSVEIDGTYYLLDSTWDETADGDASLYRWFLKGTNNFQYHELDASYRPYEGNYSPTDYASEPFTDYIPVTEIQLTPEDETVYLEETIHIVPTVLPSNATNKQLTFTSSNEEVATVDYLGRVTTITPGTTTITVSCEDGIMAEAIITVVAKDEYIYIETYSYSKSILVLFNETNTKKITVKLVPENVTDPTITWLSKDTSIANVDEDGNVTGVRPGQVDIIVSPNGASNKVFPSATTKAHIIGVAFNEESVTVNQGDTYFFENLYAYPGVDGTGSITWKSSDESIATVDENGVITGISGGDCTISATTYNETNTASIPVHVNEYPTSVSLNKTELTLKVNQSQTLQATIKEASANIGLDLTWSSSDTGIVTVDQKGKITAKKPGEATITVSTENGKQASCFVNVPVPVVPLVAAYNSVKGIDFRWKAVNGATGYDIWRKNQGKWTKIASLNGGNITQYYDEEVKDLYGKIYVYSVAARVNNLVGPYDEKGRGICRLQPPTLTSVQNGVNTNAYVEWTFGDKSSGYEVQFSDTLDFKSYTKVQVEGRNTLHTLIDGFLPGKYYFRVRSYMTDVNNITYYSQYSNVRSLQKLEGIPVVQLTGVYNSVNGIDLRWKKVPGATGYDIWRKNRGVWTKIDAIMDGEIVQIYDTEVKEEYGRIYVYAVAARVDNQVGAYNEKGRGICRLKPPVLLAVSDMDSTVLVTWSLGEKSSGYEVQVSETLDFKVKEVYLVEGRDTLSMSLSNLEKGKKYYIRVRSYMTDQNHITYYSQYTSVKTIVR